MAVGAKKLRAFAGQTLQRGKKGGTFVITETGKKRYTDHVAQPKQAAAKAAAPVKGKAVAGKATPAERLKAAKKGASAAPATTTSKSGVKFERVETSPKPKVKMDNGRERPGGGAGAQLPPAMVERLKALGVSKLPAAHIAEVQVSQHLGDDTKAHTGALLKWKDDKGRQQSAYSKKFDEVQATKKWERVTKNRPKIEAALEDMKKKALTSPAHAATLLMEHTSLRPGSDQSVKHEGHYGATTIEGRHVKFGKDGTASLEFIGKQGKLNKATVTDPAIVAALKAHTQGKGPKDRVFNVSKEEIRAAAPKGVKLKDFRTIGATKHAEQILERIGPPPVTGDKKKDAQTIARILKQVSEDVSTRLNNTPAMARRSYIAPQVITNWTKKHGVSEEMVKWP